MSLFVIFMGINDNYLYIYKIIAWRKEESIDHLIHEDFSKIEKCFLRTGLGRIMPEDQVRPLDEL